MVTDIFAAIKESPDTIEWKIKVSIVEIYMEKIRDLLDVNRNNLKVREKGSKGVYIKDVSEYYVMEAEEVLQLIKVANGNRAVSHTNMNAESSRSHSIFIMEVHQTETSTGSVSILLTIGKIWEAFPCRSCRE